MPNEVIEAETNDQIVITLRQEDAADLSVRAVDLFVGAMRVRFSAHASCGMQDVFEGDIERMLREICARSSLTTQIINVPDFCVRIRGLVIEGYTLLVHTMENGLRQFIVRLKQAVGNGLALFKMNEGPDQGLSLFTSQLLPGDENQLRADRLFDEMLSHLYLPLVNLNTYLKNALDGRRDSRGDQLKSSVVQLKTKAEVLQFAFDRLISEMMVEKFTGSGPGHERPPEMQVELH